MMSPSSSFHPPYCKPTPVASATRLRAALCLALLWTVGWGGVCPSSARADDVPATPVAVEEFEEVPATEAEAGERVPAEPLEKPGFETAPAESGEEPVAVEDAQAMPATREVPNLGVFLKSLFGEGDALDPNGDIPANLRQYMPILERSLTIEMHFLRKVCNPPPEQLAAIRTTGRSRLIEIAKKFSKDEYNAFRNEKMGPRDFLIEALVDASRKTLSPEDHDRYVAEVRARRDFRVEAAGGMMAINIDRHLSLSDEQYDKVIPTLTDRWKPGWSSNIQVFMYDQYCPLPGENDLESILDAEQRKLWQSKGRQSTIYFGWQSDVGVDQLGVGVELKELKTYTESTQEPQQ